MGAAFMEELFLVLLDAKVMILGIVWRNMLVRPDGTFTLELTTAELEQTITVETHSVLGSRLFTKELPPQRLHTLSLEGQQLGMYITPNPQNSRQKHTHRP